MFPRACWGAKFRHPLQCPERVYCTSVVLLVAGDGFYDSSTWTRPATRGCNPKSYSLGRFYLFIDPGNRWKEKKDRADRWKEKKGWRLHRVCEVLFETCRLTRSSRWWAQGLNFFLDKLWLDASHFLFAEVFSIFNIQLRLCNLWPRFRGDKAEGHGGFLQYNCVSDYITFADIKLVLLIIAASIEDSRCVINYHFISFSLERRQRELKTTIKHVTLWKACRERDKLFP